VIRIAAAGDLHFGDDAAGTLRPRLAHLEEEADILLLAGDLTRIGEPAEARLLARELADVTIPTVGVLGNHDYHSGSEDEIRTILEGAGVRVLEGEGTTLDVDGTRVAVAGTKGFGGGFPGASGSDFGEPEMKAFIGHTRHLSEQLERALRETEGDLTLVVLHYSPIRDTLQGEPPEIYPFLGSYLLAEAVDRVGADLVVHGHAHRGIERGRTPGGVEVRNVALPVIGRSYALYEADAAASREATARPGPPRATRTRSTTRRSS
jgi:Icc-related predicted phosphoesterase